MNTRLVDRSALDLGLFFWALPLVLFGSFVIKAKDSHWTRFMGVASQPSTREISSTIAPSEKEKSLDRRISTAVRRAARYLPGEHRCLAQALACQIMLSQLGRPGTVVIGLRPNHQSSTWDSHAWLVTDEGIILGGEVAGDFVPVTTYRKASST